MQKVFSVHQNQTQNSKCLFKLLTKRFNHNSFILGVKINKRLFLKENLKIIHPLS